MSRRNRTARRQRWRLWTLLFALGLVVLAMRQLKQPSTAERLGQLFGSPNRVSPSVSDGAIELSSTDAFDFVQKPLTDSQDASTSGLAVVKSDGNDPLHQVQDNTYFRPAESEAWFGFFGRLQQSTAQQLSNQTLGNLSYAQLLKQPDTYRGQVVTIRGTLRREEVEQAPKNDFGIETYHRLWLQPEGGGNWPIVAYCLELPKELPRGDHLQATLTIDGYFFKNWSYAWRDGLGIAPVVLARSVDWQPAQTQPARRTLSDQSIPLTVAIAGGFALMVVYFVIRNTRRPRYQTVAANAAKLPDQSTPTETIHEQLHRLAEGEPKP